MDGSGDLFAPLLTHLPPDWTARVVSFPMDRPLAYDRLEPFALDALPTTEPFVLVAESFSGPLAARIAAKHPPGLRALVLCATFVRNPHVAAARIAGMFIRPLFFRVPLPDCLVRAGLAGRDCPDPELRMIQRTIRRVPPEVMAFRVRKIIEADEAAALAAVTVPVLYLRPCRDWVVKPESLEEILRIKPDVTVVEIDGPHLLLQRQPRAALAAIQRFVSALEA